MWHIYVCVCVCVCIQLVLEMCRGEHPVDMQTIQPHLDRIKAPVSTAKDHHVSHHAAVFLSAVEVYSVCFDRVSLRTVVLCEPA